VIFFVCVVILLFNFRIIWKEIRPVIVILFRNVAEIFI